MAIRKCSADFLTGVQRPPLYKDHILKPIRIYAVFLEKFVSLRNLRTDGIARIKWWSCVDHSNGGGVVGVREIFVLPLKMW